MPALQARRFSRRYLERLHNGREALDHLFNALQALLRSSSGEDPLFLAHGLDLLVEQLGADLAYMVSMEGKNFETRWWSPDQGEEEPPAAVPAFCRWMAEHPERTMVLRDLAKDGRLQGVVGKAVKAALGVTLWRGGEAKAFVFVHFPKPQRFGRAELALLSAVAGFMSRCLEVEDLKASMGRLENALAITKAVMEDSSIQDPSTDLPNLRYLDIWLKANLVGVRKPEPMAVALLRAPASSRKDIARLRSAAEQIRGGDLLVTLGEGRFLLLLLGVTKGLAHILLSRLRVQLDEAPMGVTLWLPGQDDPALDSARRRAEDALRASEADPRKAITWTVIEPTPAPAVAPPAVEAQGPRIWRPKPLAPAAPEGGAGAHPGSAELAIILPPRKRQRGQG